MAIDFPNSPTNGDLFSAGGKNWQYNGTAWVLQGIVPYVRLLDDVGDVTITSETSGDFLKWNGSAWVNTPIFSASNTFTTNQVISASSSSDLLRITQTGAGNAFAVVDSTGGNGLYINSNGGIRTNNRSAEWKSWSNTANFGSTFYFDRSRGTTYDSHTAVQSGDRIGTHYFRGSDGTSFSSAVEITAAVDGTVSSGIVPGRLILSTENTAGTMTERMRIDSAGLTTITGTAVIASNASTDALRITQTGSGNALVVEDSTNPDSTPFVIFNDGKVAVGSTTSTGNALLDIVADTSLGLNIRSAGAAGSRIMLQRNAGTIASPTAVAADNILGQLRGDGYDGTSYLQAANINFVVDGAVSTGTVPGRIIFSTGTAGTTAERMRIDSAGQIGIGSGTVAGRTLLVGKAITNSTQAFAVISNGIIQSDVTAEVNSFRSTINTAAASFTLTNLTHFYVVPSATPGAGSTITTQIGFAVANTMTGASSNNYAFYGDIASGTGRYNLMMGGTAANYLAGRLGVGATLTSGAMAQVVNTTAADIALIVQGAASQSGNLLSVRNSAASNLLTIGSGGAFAVTTAVTGVAPFTMNAGLSGATAVYGILVQSTIASDVTSSADAFRTSISTAAASFTLGSARHFTAANMTVGAGSTVTNQIGFYSGAMSTGTNNFAFYGDMNAASGRWNLYMNGTAANYMAGRLGVGETLTSGAMARITNTTAADKAFVVKGAASQSGTLFEVQNSAATPLLVIDSDGKTSIGATTPLAQLHVLIGTATGVSPGTGGRLFIDGNNANNWIDIAAATTSEVGLRFGDSGGIMRGRVAYSNTNDALDFYTAGSERMRIDSAGLTTITGTAVIASNASTNALRITQTGSGNALVVEDSTNPDATSFIVDANGRAIVQANTHYAITGFGNPGLTVGSDGTYDGVMISAWYNTSTGAPSVRMGKSRSGTQGSYGIVSSGDTLANIIFGGDDGAKFVAGARISAQVDGTPGLDDMPGRLVFYTTPDGSTTTTERMRIDSAGAVGIGGTPAAGDTLRVAKNITGAINSAGVYVSGAIQSDVTTATRVFRSTPSTANSNFTMTSLHHYAVVQGTYNNITAGGAITNQYGFSIGTMSGPTNNYGFFSQIAAATGAWNLYMEGTAANYLAGRLGVGETLTSGAMARITNTTASDIALAVKGAAGQSGALLSLQNSAGTSVFSVNSIGNVNVGNNIDSSSAALEIGAARTADGNAYIDLVGDTTYTDYGARLIRTPGSNGNTVVAHRGTGSLTLQVIDAGIITFQTSTTERMRIDSNGKVTITATGSNDSNPEISLGAGSTNRLDLHQSISTGNYNPISVSGDKAIIAMGSNSTTGKGGLTIAPWSTTSYGIRLEGGSTDKISMYGTTQLFGVTAANDVLLIKGASSQSGYLTEWQDSAGTTVAYVNADGTSSFGGNPLTSTQAAAVLIMDIGA